MRIISAAGVAVALLALAATTLAAPPSEKKPLNPGPLVTPPSEKKLPAPGPLATPPVQKVVIREDALAELLRQSNAFTAEQYEQQRSELVAKLNVQKSLKRALLEQIVSKLAEAKGKRFAAEDRRAAWRKHFALKPLQDAAIAGDQSIKNLESEAAALEAQVEALQAQLASVELEIKRLLQEIEKLQRDEDEDRDRRLAEIEKDLQKAAEQLKALTNVLSGADGMPVSSDRRSATAARTESELTRIKNVREAISIGRTSKRPKPPPASSGRSNG